MSEGLRLPLEVHYMGERGWGMRCAQAIRPGEFVAEYVGELMTNTRRCAARCACGSQGIGWTKPACCQGSKGVCYSQAPVECLAAWQGQPFSVFERTCGCPGHSR